MEQIKRGEIYYANLCPVVGSEQGGIRPVVILQNDKGNLHSGTTIVAAITSEIHKTYLPTHVIFTANGMKKKSMVLLEQIRNNLRSKRRQLLKEQDENSILSGLRTLNDLLTNIEKPLTEFDENIFKNTVLEITVPTDTSVCFKLIGELMITETIPDRRRCKRQ